MHFGTPPFIRRRMRSDADAFVVNWCVSCVQNAMRTPRVKNTQCPQLLVRKYFVTAARGFVARRLHAVALCDLVSRPALSLITTFTLKVTIYEHPRPRSYSSRRMLNLDIPSATGASPSSSRRFKYESLQTTPQTRTTTTADGKSHELHQHLQSMAPITQSRRSVSCFEFGSAKRRYRTIRIGNDSEEMRELSQANVANLVKTATSPANANSTNALLARKALRFRKIWAAEAEVEAESTSVWCS